MVCCGFKKMVFFFLSDIKSKPLHSQPKVLTSKTTNCKTERIWRRMVQKVYNILDDFAEELEAEPETDDDPPLTVKQCCILSCLMFQCSLCEV